MRGAGRLILLVALWLLAWGEFTLANLVSGIAVAVALLLVFPPGRPDGVRLSVRPIGAARLAWYVGVQLLTSNLVVAREVIRRKPSVHPGVLAHRLRWPSDEVITLMSSVIALSPGTMTVDVDPDPTTMYVHFLLLRDVDAARASLVRLERLVAGTISDPRWTRSPDLASPKETP
jgi:multicomponent Na+:H+ antiporter subunit E